MINRALTFPAFLRVAATTLLRRAASRQRRRSPVHAQWDRQERYNGPARRRRGRDLNSACKAACSPIATVKTDASGRYEFNNPQLGAAPMLVRVVYRGVNYHEPIPPGKNVANVDVFEPTDKTSAFTVPNHAVIVQPRGSELMVGEEYIISNKTTPPGRLLQKGRFVRFLCCRRARRFDQASAWGSSGMPVFKPPSTRARMRWRVAFPFRPGESGVRHFLQAPVLGQSHDASERGACTPQND